MSAGGTAFLTYLWHYIVARLLYDGVVRPLVLGMALAACVMLWLRRRVR